MNLLDTVLKRIAKLCQEKAALLNARNKAMGAVSSLRLIDNPSDEESLRRLLHTACHNYFKVSLGPLDTELEILETMVALAETAAAEREGGQA